MGNAFGCYGGSGGPNLKIAADLDDSVVKEDISSNGVSLRFGDTEDELEFLSLLNEPIALTFMYKFGNDVEVWTLRLFRDLSRMGCKFQNKQGTSQAQCFQAMVDKLASLSRSPIASAANMAPLSTYLKKVGRFFYKKLDEEPIHSELLELVEDLRKICFRLLIDEMLFFDHFRISAQYKQMQEKLVGKASADEFEYYEKIGEGAFGLILWCKHKASGVYYAMKVQNKAGLLRHHAAKPQNAMNEILVLMEHQHPFLCNPAFAFQDKVVVMMALPVATCGDLRRFISLKPDARFKPARVRFYVAELSTALRHLHKHGVIFRDLKPDNVLLCADGHILLTDFGSISAPPPAIITRVPSNSNPNAWTSTWREEKSFSVDGAPPQLLTLVGTVEYMAPEVVALFGKSTIAYSFQVDWWNLGVLTHLLLTGKHPFSTNAVLAVLAQTAKKVLKEHKGAVQPFYTHFFGELSLQLENSEIAWPVGKEVGSGECNVTNASDMLRGLLAIDPAVRYSLGESFPYSSKLCTDISTGGAVLTTAGSGDPGPADDATNIAVNSSWGRRPAKSAKEQHENSHTRCNKGNFLLTHPFFKGIDWKAIESRQTSPFMPSSEENIWNPMDGKHVLSPRPLQDLLMINRREDWVDKSMDATVVIDDSIDIGNGGVSMNAGSDCGAQNAFTLQLMKNMMSAPLSDAQQLLFMEWNYINPELTKGLLLQKSSVDPGSHKY